MNMGPRLILRFYFVLCAVFACTSVICVAPNDWAEGTTSRAGGNSDYSVAHALSGKWWYVLRCSTSGIVMNRVRPNQSSGDTTARGRTVVVVGIMLLIALVHFFRVGTYLRGTLFTLYYSYFSDIVVPFGMYFLLFLVDVRVRFLRDWRVKATLVFGVASSTEVMQAFGVPLLGRTFDPLDFVMFGGGVLLAALTDRFLFDRLLPCWSPKTGDSSDVIRSSNRQKAG